MHAPPPVLSIRNLRKAYGSVVAVDGLDLEVRAQECFGLIGPNGAGKTTTIEICEGLLERDSGRSTSSARPGSATDRRFVSGSASRSRKHSSPRN